MCANVYGCTQSGMSSISPRDSINIQMAYAAEQQLKKGDGSASEPLNNPEVDFLNPRLAQEYFEILEFKISSRLVHGVLTTQS